MDNKELYEIQEKLITSYERLLKAYREYFNEFVRIRGLYEELLYTFMQTLDYLNTDYKTIYEKVSNRMIPINLDYTILHNFIQKYEDDKQDNKCSRE